MATNHETGHAVNANNFVEKVNVVKLHETEYKPTNSFIQLSVLTPKGVEVMNATKAVNNSATKFSLAVTKRNEADKEMENLATRSISMLNSSEATAAEKKQGKSLLSKFRSVRVSKVPPTNVDGTSTTSEISSSEQGYVKRLSHFWEIIEFLKIVPAYIPNEDDLKITALEAHAKKVDTLNKERNNLETEWKEAIDVRNNLLYTEPTGAYELSKQIMSYVAGAFGKESAFYTELLRFPVRSIKNK